MTMKQIRLVRLSDQEISYQVIQRVYEDSRNDFLLVLEANSLALRFWRKVGFVETGEGKPYSQGLIQSRLILMEKRHFRNELN